jgi:hypothetical protein
MIPQNIEYSILPNRVKQMLDSGRTMEGTVHQALRHIGEYIIKKNNLDPDIYPHEYGIDIVTAHFVISCKNPRITTFLNDKIMNEDIDTLVEAMTKYPDKMPLLIIANLRYTKRIAQRLHALHITVVKVGLILPTREPYTSNREPSIRNYADIVYEQTRRAKEAFNSSASYPIEAIAQKLKDILRSRIVKPKTHVRTNIFGAKPRLHNIIDSYSIDYTIAPIDTQIANLKSGKYYPNLTRKERFARIPSLMALKDKLIASITGITKITSKIDIPKIVGNTQIDNTITDSQRLNQNHLLQTFSANIHEDDLILPNPSSLSDSYELYEEIVE